MKITVVAGDEKIITEVEVLKKSSVIQEMLSSLGVDDMKDDDTTLPLQNISAAIMKKVLAWCEHHKNDVDEDEINANTKNSAFSEWDKQFFDMDLETLKSTLLAANFLDIKGLMNSSCKAIALMIKGKGPDDVCNTFNIQRRLKPEAMETNEQEVKAENGLVKEETSAEENLTANK